MRFEEMASRMVEIGRVDVPTQVDERPEGAVQDGSLLSTSRRIDWRFLLPEPALGRVLCVEPIADGLREALRVFGTSLTPVNPGNDGNSLRRGVYDLVVACNPSHADLARMAGSVKPGGFIFLEAYGLAARFAGARGPIASHNTTQRTFAWPLTYSRALETLEFAEIQVHWHWPNFDSCKMMIPLGDTAAVRLALDRGGQGLKAGLRKGLGRLLLWSGLLPWTVPCFSVLARRRME